MTLAGKRILIAKPGLDGHDVGAKVIALALRDAGADVIYTGLRQSPEQVVNAAVQEDVDAIGLSVLSGAHNDLVAETMALLHEMAGGEIKVFVGGTIPADDRAALLQRGCSGVFTAEQKLDEVLAELERCLA